MNDYLCQKNENMEKNRKLRVDELNRPSVEEYRVMEKLPITVVLDNIRSLNNVGSIFRTSDALLVERLILCGITGCPPHPEIHRTALGAEDSVVWQYFDTTVKAVDYLKREGYFVVSLEQAEQTANLMRYRPLAEKKYALVFGNELRGVGQEVIDRSDECIEIPQFGTKHSFNVSVTAGIVLWDFVSKLKGM